MDVSHAALYLSKVAFKTFEMIMDLFMTWIEVSLRSGLTMSLNL